MPALAGYPQWFMAAAPRKTDTNGHLGPAVNTIMVFERSAADEPWTLNGTAVLGQGIPDIATDRDGYAIPVSHSDPGLLLPPDVVGASQGAVVDEGPATVRNTP